MFKRCKILISIKTVTIYTINDSKGVKRHKQEKKF